MESETLARERGWSISSEHTEKSGVEDLTEDQKKALLENYPVPDTDDDDLFRQDDEDATDRPKKKAKTDESETTISAMNDTTVVAPNLLTHAKQKLSKWAARLFDPNRIRGLVEAPQVIPLNDEFLKAFGQREKEFDRKLGRTLQIDSDQIIGDSDESDGDYYHGTMQLGTIQQESDNESSRRIKIMNLPFTTTQETLTKLCNTYGPTSVVNLVMDKIDPQKAHLNIGRAYVTFEQAADAQACMDHMTTCEGRTLRLSWARTKHPTASNTNAHARHRYWERDISSKCYRCQQVGHIAPNCPNPIKLPPCPLCMNVDGSSHDLRDCSYSRFCFRCGLPGHINRDCPSPSYTNANRTFCSICFSSSHHREDCRQDPLNAADLTESKCMVCGRTGHLMCQEMKWFFGLHGVSCFNCGSSTHHGYRCDRPTLDQCSRDENLCRRELELAPSIELREQMQARNEERWRSRGREFDRDRNFNRPVRSESQPPSSRGYQSNVTGPSNGRSISTGRSYPDNTNQLRGNNRGYR